MKIRQQALAFSFIVLASGIFAGIASADLAKSSGDASVKSIPEHDPALSNSENTTISTVTITAADIDPGDTGPIVDVFFTIEGLTHSHLSDLTVRVRHRETNRVATLFERVGIIDESGNGGIDNQNVDGDGDSSNFSGSYRFRDDGDSLWGVALATSDDEVIPTLNTQDGSFLPVYAASGAQNGDVGLFSIFATNDSGASNTLQSVIGNWDFEISDRSNQTPVTDVPPALIQSFTRTNVFFDTEVVVAIPEPGSALALLLGLAAATSRRRRA